MIYRYQDLASYLTRLAYTWRQKVRLIAHPFGSQTWGPSEEALAEISLQEFTPQLDSRTEQVDSEDDDSSGSSRENDSDEELFDHMEALVLNEHYQESRHYITADVDISLKRRRVE